jgi:chemotaxis protein MotB
MTFASCVSKKKFNDMSIKKSKLEVAKADCEDSLKVLIAERNRLRDQLDQYMADNTKLQEDSAKRGNELRKLDKDYETLSNSFEKLLKNHSKLQNYSAAEADRLTKDLLKREKELLDAQRKSDALQQDLELREVRVKELEKIISDKDKAVNSLKAAVSKALLSFNDKDLTVEVKNGKVYVSLAEQLLFKSGSYVVDTKGIEALRKLAAVLKEEKDISIMVEGHTDDVPISKSNSGIKDNWDLSVMRATSITRILVESGANPKNVIPAGRADNVPLDESKTSDGRKKNRRTEIVLTPNLDELLKILEKH